MSKKRKTKKEKIISDFRKRMTVTANTQSQSDSSPASPTYNFKSTPERTPVTHSKLHVLDYSYVKADIIKTISITAIIFLFNIFLSVLLEKNIIHINFLSF